MTLSSVDWLRWAWGAGIVLIAAPIGVVAGIDPKLAIAGALGCGFVLLAFSDLTLAVAAFGFISFLELASIGDSALNATKVAGLLLALSWFALLTTGEESSKDNFFVSHPLVSGALGLFLGWVALSVVWSEDPGKAFAASGRYALNVLLFLIVYAAVRKRADLILVVGAFVAGAAAAAVTGLVTPTANPALGDRLNSGALDPNALAATLVAGAVLAIGLAGARGNSASLRLAALCVFPFCVVATLLTASRGSLISLGVAIIAGLILAGRWRPQVAILAAVLVAGGFFYFANLASEQTLERIEQTTSGESRSSEGRTTIWQVGWRAYEANPVIGVGAGNFSTASRHYLLQPGSLPRSDEIVNRPIAAHNTYLEVAAELGTIGIVLFATIVCFSLSSAIVAGREFGKTGDPGMQVIAIALAVALIGVLAADTFISEQYSKQLWLLLGVGPALLSLARSGPSTGSGEPSV